MKAKSHERAILVELEISSLDTKNKPNEFHELALSAGVEPVLTITGKRLSPDSKYFVGAGKADEILQAVKAYKVDAVLFNHVLTPSQQRNLEKLLNCKIIDRVNLILDIFAQRARTFAGKLQVELAQLKYLSTRLVRGWTHLERQKGGIGLRGPGETQLEEDRRSIRLKIGYIQKRLQKVHSQRQQLRSHRMRSAVATVSLVGYTNAGKSTLFNQLTSANAYVANQLFATLDPTSRKIKIPNFGETVLIDTVGFISDLPHDLIEAFKATLEETREADLLLHVIDAADADRENNIVEVNKVLVQIDADKVPQLMVFNKIDLLENATCTIDRDEFGKPIRVWISAAKGLGIDLLQQAISELIGENRVICCVKLTPQEAKIRAQLHAVDAVIKEEMLDNGDMILEVCLPEERLRKMIND